MIRDVVVQSQVCPVTWHESLLLWARCSGAEGTRGQGVSEWKTQEGVNRNTFQAPYILKDQPTAVSPVVTSLLLLGHEPFPSALPALKGIPFICRGSGPSIRADGHISTVVSSWLFFCYFKVCYGLTIETWSWPRAQKNVWNGLSGILTVAGCRSVLRCISVNPHCIRWLPISGTGNMAHELYILLIFGQSPSSWAFWNSVSEAAIRR
jgi:hypothetical protein